MTPTRRLLILLGGILGGASTGGASIGCVLPDRDIQIVDENIQNKHAVRFVEPTPLSPQALDACDAARGDDLGLCQPGEPEAVLPTYLDPTYLDPGSNTLIYNFCSCDRAAGEQSLNQLNEFSLYVEDRLDDVDKSASPLYAAALLDLGPNSLDPQNSVRYRDYIDPLRPLDLDDQLEYKPLKRPDPLLRVLNVGNGNPIDLCNRANDTPLRAGIHELRIIVTDRPWFKVDPEDVEGQAGVPDIANGATFDTISYIFRCDDKTAEHCQKIDCVKPMEQP
ncbi:MAG: hypothetical protein H0T76_28010 [Nannocystis sp.]|nr:hypothetical protein [Nannocystis sp.]MBA3550337.1 hypothetical protein [Nannocystis sp.]